MWAKVSLVALVFLLIFTVPIIGRAENNWVRVIGSSQFDPDYHQIALDDAWEEAVRDGIRQALQKHYPVYVEAASVLENSAVSWDRVITSVSGPVIDIKVISTEHTSDLLQVTLDVLLVKAGEAHHKEDAVSRYFGNPAKLMLAPPRIAGKTLFNDTFFGATTNQQKQVFIITDQGIALVTKSGNSLDWVRGAPSKITNGLLQGDKLLVHLLNGDLQAFHITTENYPLKENHPVIKALWKQEAGSARIVGGQNEGAFFLLQYPTRDLLIMDWQGEIHGQYRMERPLQSAFIDDQHLLFATALGWELIDLHTGYRLSKAGVGVPLAHPVKDKRSVFLLQQGGGVYLSKWTLDGQSWWTHPLTTNQTVSGGQIYIKQDSLFVALNDTSGKGVVLRVHPTTGEVLWRRSFDSHLTGPLYLLDQVLYVPQYGELAAVDANRGIMLWENYFPGEIRQLILLDGDVEQLVVFTEPGHLFSLQPSR